MILRNDSLFSSYSQIDNFYQCPMKWYMDKVLGLKEDIPNKHLIYGLAVHEFMEDVMNEKMICEDMGQSYHIKNNNLQYYLNLMTEKLEEKEIPFDNESEKEQYHNQAFDLVNYLYNVEDEFLKLLFESEILGAEVPFSLDFDIPARNYQGEDGSIIVLDSVGLNGFIDLVLKYEDKIIGVDYKTSSKKFDKSKLKNNLQFPIYSMAIKQIFGEYPAENYYFFTKLLEAQKVIFTEEITEEQETRMNKRGSKEIYSLPPKDAEMEIKKVFKEMSKYQLPSKNKPKCNPTPLCYYCDFGKHNTGICKGSSDWQPKDKIKES